MTIYNSEFKKAEKKYLKYETQNMSPKIKIKCKKTQDRHNPIRQRGKQISHLSRIIFIIQEI